ncbi:MAG: class I tRNA ligase family protein, partial [Aquiluna sp.]
SDAMRWFLMSSPILRGGNISVTEQGIREGVRQALLPLWNSYYFFSLYANAANYVASPSMASTQLLDRYILAKTRELIESVQLDLDNYDSYLASARVRDFAEVLTNWYIRRSRDRFWEGDKDAFDTLYTVLEAVLRACAPLLPLTTEEMWRGLTGGRSVHLESWPEADEFPWDEALVRDMDAIREAASVALSLRKAAGLRVRLPLSELTLAVSDAKTIGAYADLIADELNVKSVRVVEASDEVASEFGLSKALTINARALGPRIGKAVQEVIGMAKAGNWSMQDGSVRVGDYELQEGEYELTMVAQGSETSSVGLTSTGFVLLNLEVTHELEQEGRARDAIRLIQQARKDAGLEVSDRIWLKLAADAQSAEALELHGELIAAETLATEFTVEVSEAGSESIGEDGKLAIELGKK